MTLWGGRFSQKMDADAWKLNASISFDYRLAAQDVAASIAWAGQLAKIGVLTEEEHQLIRDGLAQIQTEFSSHIFTFLPEDEDIHTAVERRLYEQIGPAAGKLHTGRSRNDQVATDFRLWVMENSAVLIQAVAGLQAGLVARAEQDMGIIMPSYTHLQRAQPILLSHWWLSFFWPLERDRQRMKAAQAQAAVLPLGSGAVAGSSFPVNRHEMARELGFGQVSQNSIDAVSDRDFAAEFLFNAALCGVHLSRFAEQIILFTSSEFGFFTLSDAFSTGSSLMPQKKNADVFELTRGKCATLLGLLSGLLAALKGLPSAYDKDLQEDKQAVFQAFDTLTAVLPVISGAVQTLSVSSQKIAAALDPGLFATDIADALVKQGIPFREAHAIVGQAVRKAMEKGIGLDDLPDENRRTLAKGIRLDWKACFSPQQSIAARTATGGTAPQAVTAQIELAKKLLQAENQVP